MLWRRVGLGPLGVWREFSHQKLLGGDWNHGILFSIKNWLVVTGTMEFYSPSKTGWWFGTMEFYFP
jgi:hypothetical protein